MTTNNPPLSTDDPSGLIPPTWAPQSARWIWTEADDRASNIYACFWRKFSLDRAPAGETLYLSANSRYRIWINGVFVGDGPPPTPWHWRYVDQYSADPFLRQGENIMAVTVHHVGDQPDSRGGFLLELRDRDGVAFEASGSDWLAGGQDAWKAKTFSFRMNWFDCFQEVHDARLLPPLWQQNGESPSWPAARVIDFAPKLWSRDIPLLERTPLAAETILRAEEATALANRVRSEDASIVLSMPGRPVEHAVIRNAEAVLSLLPSTPLTLDVVQLPHGRMEPALVLDFGKIVRGCIDLDVTSVAGARLDLGFAEQLIDGWFNNSVEGQFAASATFREGRQTWRTFSWRGFRYLKLRLMEKGPLVVHRLAVLDEHLPGPAPATFESSDSLLNDVFIMCRNTLELGRHEIQMDTPWREQGQWLGDSALVTTPGIRWCFGDTANAGKFFREAAWAQRADGLLENLSSAQITPGVMIANPIPDYSLFWIEGLWEHRRDVDDARWTALFYPQIRSILRSFLPHLAADGLITHHPNWVLIDWAPVDVRGKSAALNALYARALRLGIRVAEELGHADDAGEWRQVLQKLGASFDDRFWDSRRNAYVDAWNEGKQSEVLSEHTQASVLYAGLATGERAAAALDLLRPLTPPGMVEAQPFFCSFLLRVLVRAGRWDTALELIRRRWGDRFVAYGHTTTPEEWSDCGTYRHGPFLGIMRSRSHPWSAFPAEFFLRLLPGLKMLPRPGRDANRTLSSTPLDYKIQLPCGESRWEVTGKADRP